MTALDRLGGVAEDRDGLPARRVDELSDGVVRPLEERRHRRRGGGLAAVHVLVVRRELAAQVQQLQRRLGAGSVVGDDASPSREQEVAADGSDIERTYHATLHVCP
jgi:hypothetical protein